MQILLKHDTLARVDQKSFSTEKSMSKEFQTRLQKYADVAVQIGLDLKKGQRLIVSSTLEAQELTRAVVRSAYRAGALEVFVNWADDELAKIHLEEGSEDSLKASPQWLADAYAKLVDEGAARIRIGPSDPDILAGQDPKRMKMRQMAQMKAFQAVSDRIMNNVSNWTIVNSPHPAITAKMFPELSPEEGHAAHWEAIFEACRINQADPVAAWKAHIEDLEARGDYLTHKAYQGLHYKAPGTDLTVGLPKGHIWATARQSMQNGTRPVVNMPSEEVYTLAHADQIDGVVSSSKPLPYNGTIIEHFSLQFSEGRVVSAKAEKGQDALDNLLNTDEGARSIGELALVPHSSPISQSGLTFYSILFDENASNHIALGRAYRFTLEGGVNMSDEEFAAAGGNYSLTHVDFMIGSGAMDVDGICEDGSYEPVMRGGEWAFE